MDVRTNLVSIRELEKVPADGGEVLHVINSNTEQFNGFKEAYFSIINPGHTKAWKLHKKMTMNLVVPIGSVQFIFYTIEKELILNAIIGKDNYSLITVKPGVWFGFKGLSKEESYVLNIANIIHDPNEVERKPSSFLKFLSI